MVTIDELSLWFESEWVTEKSQVTGCQSKTRYTLFEKRTYLKVRHELDKDKEWLIDCNVKVLRNGNYF